MQTVRRLAGEIGPREATTSAYRTAARVVERRLRRLGYDVRGQQLRVPEGVSWGVPVPAGRTRNVVATEAGFDVTRPHLVVGAHLDTVPQAPGAEDNASGVAVLLELAAMAAGAETRLPVVFVAFGAEEPRGEGDAMHHFGSQTLVRRMSEGERAAVHAMVSLDRVGVGGVVPVCTGGLSPPLVRAALVGAGRAVGVSTQVCADNQSSDHWSFEKAGVPAARLGSTPYAAYHSPDDLPGVVRQDQLERVGRLMWEWMRE
ncbi:MAG: M28 family peptidase [Propionibacteriales bacterium]|nr:M28 family peptidase [Propionibacteriales bacterium]